MAHLGVRVGVGWLVAVHAGRVSSLHSLPCGLWCAETRGPVARSPIAWWPQSGHVLSFVAWVVALTFCLSCLRLQLGHALLSPTAPPLPISTSALMAHVLARQFCRLQSSGAANLPQGSLPPGVLNRRIFTPLWADAWEQALADHPQQGWVHALVQGMRSGFRIGLQPSAQCRSDARLRPSAQGHSQVVSEFLRQQVAAGYMMGPFDPQECSGSVTSSIGVVPKSTPRKVQGHSIPLLTGGSQCQVSSQLC